jgi:transposase
MKKVDAQTEHEIIRHHLVDQWPLGTIANQLGVHHDVITRVLRQRGAAPQYLTVMRKQMIDPYVPVIAKVLEKYPDLHASRLYQMMCDRGYPGRSDGHFRRQIARIRPRKLPEPFARLDMPAGEQAQMDWGHFGKVAVGRAMRRLCAHLVTLSWSRMVFLQFFYEMQMPCFLRGHVDAFEFFGGVPRRIIYDNLKSACVERYGKAIHFNESFLQAASHYGFEPILAAPRRGNEKGRVERSVGYVRTNFFAAREFRDLDDLNEQARQWCLRTSAARRWPDDDRTTVGAQFAQEKKVLRALPPTPFETADRIQVRVGRTPYIRFDTNDYSVPWQHVRSTVTVLAEPHRIRVSVQGQIVAEHARTYDRRATIENPEHIDELRQAKARSREGAGMHRLTQSAPAVRLMLQNAAKRGHNLGSLVAKLLELLDMYGADEMQAAVHEANLAERIGAGPVRMCLESRFRSQGRTPPRPVPISNSKARDITVAASDMSIYDALKDEKYEES